MFDFMVGNLVRTGALVEVLRGPPIHAVSAPDRSRSPNVRAIVELAIAAFERVSS